MERRQQKIEQAGHNAAQSVQGSSSNQFFNSSHGVKVRTGEDGVQPWDAQSFEEAQKSRTNPQQTAHSTLLRSFYPTKIKNLLSVYITL
jgi:hypothetical protein